MENKKSFDGKSAIAQCFCIDDEATLILFRKGFSIFLITPLGDFTRLQHQETTPPPTHTHTHTHTQRKTKTQKIVSCERPFPIFVESILIQIKLEIKFAKRRSDTDNNV